MRKALGTLAAFAVAALMAGALVGCSSNAAGGGAGASADASDGDASAAQEAAEASASASSTQVVDKFSNMPEVSAASGERLVSDGKYLYFTYNDNDNPENNGIYRTTLSLGETILLDRGECSYPCIVGGRLYYFRDGDDSGIRFVDLETLEPGDAEGASASLAEDLARFSGGVQDADGNVADGEWLAWLSFGDMRIAPASGSDQQSIWERGLFDYMAILHLRTGDSLIYLTYTPSDGGSDALIAVDPMNREAQDVATLPVDRLFAVVGDTVYFVGVKKSGADAPYELMRWTWDGQVEHTGVTGVFSSGLVPYGDYVFYTKEVQADDGEGGTGEFNRPFCYNTATGEEYMIDRAMYAGGSGSVLGVSDDLMLFSDGSFESIMNAETSIPMADLVAGSVLSDALAREDDEARAAAEEALANEPYGPGTSTLYLSAPEDKSACFRLVRVDGSTEFMVLLGPGEEAKQTFPCGRYTLKTAEGDEWISDEEAFGPDGDYSTTDLFRFEDGGAYEISTGSRGDFRGDSAGGFTG